MEAFVEKCAGLFTDIRHVDRKQWEIVSATLESAKEISRYLQSNRFRCSAIYHNDGGDFSIYIYL